MKRNKKRKWNKRREKKTREEDGGEEAECRISGCNNIRWTITAATATATHKPKSENAQQSFVLCYLFLISFSNTQPIFSLLFKFCFSSSSIFFGAHTQTAHTSRANAFKLRILWLVNRVFAYIFSVREKLTHYMYSYVFIHHTICIFIYVLSCAPGRFVRILFRKRHRICSCSRGN